MYVTLWDYMTSMARESNTYFIIEEDNRVFITQESNKPSIAREGNTLSTARESTTISIAREGNRFPIAREGRRLSMAQAGSFLWLLTVCAGFLAAAASVAPPVEGPHELPSPACIFMDSAKRNGETWHPYIQPFGVASCILCVCQNGSVDCQRENCPQLKCARTVRRPKTCCDKCDGNTIIKKTEKNKGCTERFTGINRTNGEQWQPISSRHKSSDCDVCKCKNRKITCRTKCPGVCQRNLGRNPCCQYCSDEVKAKAMRHVPATKEPGKIGQGAEKVNKFPLNIRHFVNMFKEGE